jgi:SAM-dependent methyltransferase
VSEEIYRDHGDVYATFAETSLTNAIYDRPAMLRLAGDLDGRRVLELGCAAGGLTAGLVERGAVVLGLDREPSLVDRARQRGLGERARFQVADLEEPLDLVKTASMDVVVASLVLHYLRDWRPLLTELHRILVPGGSLVFSIHHPMTGWALSDHADYHRTELIHEDWNWDGLRITAGMYRRPLSEVFGPVRRAGFTIDVVDEPLPESVSDGDPVILNVLETQPVFLFVRAIRAAGDAAPAVG